MVQDECQRRGRISVPGCAQLLDVAFEECGDAYVDLSGSKSICEGAVDLCVTFEKDPLLLWRIHKVLIVAEVGTAALGDKLATKVTRGAAREKVHDLPSHLVCRVLANLEYNLVGMPAERNVSAVANAGNITDARLDGDRSHVATARTRALMALYAESLMGEVRVHILTTVLARRCRRCVEFGVDPQNRCRKCNPLLPA